MNPQLEKYINSKKYKEEFDHLGVSSDFVPQLIQLAANEDSKIRIRAIYALGRMAENGLQNRDEAINTFLKALYDENKWVRGHAAHFVGRMYYPEERIIDLMEDGCPWVRHRAAEAAGLIGTEYPQFGEKAAPQLASLLEDRSSYVQYIALEALKKISAQNHRSQDFQKILHESGN